MAKKDYYEILGVSKNATTEEIIAAYKKKAMLYHPDRQQGKSEAEKKEAEEHKEPETKVCPYCLTEIKYHATRCPHCTSELGETVEK